MLIARITGDCPKCKGSKTFGNCGVFGRELLRGCEDCEYRERYRLPELKKDILYLDQFFFSHAFHGTSPQFNDAIDRLNRAAHEQLLAAPFSSLHEEEAALYKEREDLREFIRSTSRGHKFEAQYQVEQTQVVRAFSAWLKGQPADYVLEQRDALDRDVNNWESYLTIEVRGFRHDPEVIRASKLQSIEQLVSIFDDWRKSSSTFEEDVAAESFAAARNYANSYLHMAQQADAGYIDAVAFPTRGAHIMASLLGWLGRKMEVEERWKLVINFLQSEHFRSAPFRRLSSRMFAALKAQVKNGAYTDVEEAKNKRLKGFFYDVNHIATYAPYCNAIVIDKPMYAIVTHPSVALEATYGVKVFCRTNWDEFLAWIDGLKDKKTPEHEKALELIHEKSFGSTFTKMKRSI